MKRFLLLAAVLLSLTGCQNDLQETASLDAVMAAAAADGMLPVQEIAEIAEDVEWDGVYVDGSRSVTLSLGTDGALSYHFSEGSRGRADEVSGSTAKTAALCFSLSGDTLSVLGSAHTGNYIRT